LTQGDTALCLQQMARNVLVAAIHCKAAVLQYPVAPELNRKLR